MHYPYCQASAYVSHQVSLDVVLWQPANDRKEIYQPLAKRILRTRDWGRFCLNSLQIALVFWWVCKAACRQKRNRFVIHPSFDSYVGCTGLSRGSFHLASQISSGGRERGRMRIWNISVFICYVAAFRWYARGHEILFKGGHFGQIAVRVNADVSGSTGLLCSRCYLACG